MVKAKSDKSQKAITSFFGGKKEPKEPVDEVIEEETSSDDVVKPQASKAPKKKVKKEKVKDYHEEASDDDLPAHSAKTDGKIESSNLPPIHETPAMFSDLVSRLPGIKGVAEHIKGRKLRVATMCSGTESPLLALDLIDQVLREH